MSYESPHLPKARRWRVSSGPAWGPACWSGVRGLRGAHEPRRVREGPDGRLTMWEQCALGVARTRGLQRSKAVAAGLEVADGVGAPQGVAEVGGLVARGEQSQVDLGLGLGLG